MNGLLGCPRTASGPAPLNATILQRKNCSLKNFLKNTLQRQKWPMIILSWLEALIRTSNCTALKSDPVRLGRDPAIAADRSIESRPSKVCRIHAVFGTPRRSPSRSWRELSGNRSNWTRSCNRSRPPHSAPRQTIDCWKHERLPKALVGRRTPDFFAILWRGMRSVWTPNHCLDFRCRHWVRSLWFWCL